MALKPTEIQAQSASQNAIEFHGVDMVFGKNLVLKNIQLQIPRRQKFVLVGPSGQGKSVLLKLAADLLQPSKGRVLVNGINWATAKTDERLQLQRKIGMLFQKNALFDSLTVMDNVCFPLRETTNKTESEIKDIAEHFLQAVGLGASKALYPNEISGGMQKRLGIARALALDPEIILYDDPTAGLDPITSRKIIDLILVAQQQKNATVLAITNDMNRAYQLADKIGMVFKQELIQVGSPEQAKNSENPAVYQFLRGLEKGPITEREVQ